MKCNSNSWNTQLLWASTLAIAALLAGCSSSSETEIQPSQSQAEEISLPQADALFGIWERTGYGDVLVVDETGADFFQYNQMGCVETDRLDNNDIADVFNEPQLSADGASLITKFTENLPFDTHFERLVALPLLCESNALITDNSPTATFEYLWHTFNDYYAFFSERAVDWDAQYAEIRPLVTDSLSNDELAEALVALLDPLDDGHISLVDGDGDGFYDGGEPRGAIRAILDSFGEQTEFDSAQAYANYLVENYRANLASYFDDGSSTEVIFGTDNENDGALWATMRDQQVGYLQWDRMEEIASNGDESLEADLSAVNTIMQNVLNDLQDTSAMIIDIRVNPGGDDAIGFAIANYFTDEERLVVSKTTRSIMGNTNIVEATIGPASDSPYLQPVVVIAASDTSSAAEVFLMAMSALPNVTLVGENSHGIFSNILEKSLPNGWGFSLSNEVYTDFMGINHEGTGIPPDIEAATFSVEAITQNIDPAIEAALETLGF